jgi:hypothetical protein
VEDDLTDLSNVNGICQKLWISFQGVSDKHSAAMDRLQRSGKCHSSSFSCIIDRKLHTLIAIAIIVVVRVTVVVVVAVVVFVFIVEVPLRHLLNTNKDYYREPI